VNDQKNEDEHSQPPHILRGPRAIFQGPVELIAFGTGFSVSVGHEGRVNDMQQKGEVEQIGNNGDQRAFSQEGGILVVHSLGCFGGKQQNQIGGEVNDQKQAQEKSGESDQGFTVNQRVHLMKY